MLERNGSRSEALVERGDASQADWDIPRDRNVTDVPESGTSTAEPRRILSSIDVGAIIIGLVVGAGIFKAPSVVAMNTDNEFWMLVAWLLGGLISLAGALCYAELTSTYPDTGGEYHFLVRAYNKSIAFLFAWSRLAVLQTGSIALLAFVLGDYLATLQPLGPHGVAIYAALAVALLTFVNVVGLHTSTRAQRMMTAITVAGLIFIVVAGLTSGAPVHAIPAETGDASRAFGLAMVFVLLTFGGWNECAYVSAELRDAKRGMTFVLAGSVAFITIVYLLVNVAFLNRLGLEGVRHSEVVANDAMRAAVGDIGALIVTLLIIVAVFDSIHMSILTGARTSYAMARDFPMFRFLGGWHGRANAPVNALWTQGAISLLLVLIGAFSRSGFETMVHYVAPVFWFFFFLTTVSLFVMRRRDPARFRPFRVPGYPFTPLLFAASCVYMLYSSIAYTGFGALLGIAVLAAGIPILYFVQRNRKSPANS